MKNSEEDKFWKFVSRTQIYESLINLDKRLLTNYYKFSILLCKSKLKFSSIRRIGNANLVYSIEVCNRFTINKIQQILQSI